MQLDFLQETPSWKFEPLPPVPTGTVIGVDTETHDPHLHVSGPGWRTNKAAIAGVSISFARQGQPDFENYFAVGHRYDNTHSTAEVMDWIHAAFRDPSNTIVMANAPYDTGMFSTEGIEYPADCEDIVLNESMLHQDHPDGNGLDALAFRYLGLRKEEGGLETAVRNYGLFSAGESTNYKAHLWKLPPAHVAKYATADARLARLILPKQLAELRRQDQMEIHALEKEIMPCVHLMTKRGIDVDLPYAEQLNQRWMAEELRLLNAVGAGSVETLGSKDFLVREFKKRDLPLGTTKKGNVSIDKFLLAEVAKRDPWAAQLLECRTLVKIRRDYLVASVLVGNHRGKVHPEFIQRSRGSSEEDDDSEGGGTRTGRFACKNPNIQQVPKRAKYASFSSKDLRKIYLPPSGARWAKYDYNSQEPRMQVHYGLILGLPGAKEVAEGFANNVKLYTTLEKLLPEITYDQAKTLVLGISYGMGAAKMALQLGCSEKEAKRIMGLFNDNVAYIAGTARQAEATAQKKGYITGILGSRHQFEWWEPADYEHKDRKFGARVFGREAAERRWPKERLQRADTRKSYNKLIQGGCGTQTKLAIRDGWRAKEIPLMTVHDEVSWAVGDDAHANRCLGYMENAFTLKLPSRADMDVGSSWC